jgi:raffinose/stachyose/melibiose transport system substrate-binding protein
MKGQGRLGARAGALVAVVTALVVAACGGSSGSGAAPDGSAPPAAAAESITAWVNSAEAQPLKDMYARFTEESGIKVDVVSFPSDGFETAVMQRWASGDRPDVLEWHANYNWLVAINPKETLRDLSAEPFASAQVGGITAGLDGVTYGVVLNTPTAFGLYYNKPIFERLGLTPPTTADEVLATCQAIKAADPTIAPLREYAGSKWTPLVAHGAYQADALAAGFMDKLIAREVKVNDPDSPWLASLEFYTKLLDNGCFNADILTAQFETAGKDLLDGNAAMVSMHTGLVQQALDASDVATVDATIGWTPWAGKKPVVTVEYSPIGTYYLPKTGNAGREAAALQFMTFMTGPAYADYVEAAAMIPTLKDVPTPDGIPAPMLQIQEAVTKDGTANPIWVALPGITDLVNYPGQLINGDLTPQSAVDLLQKQAEQGAKAANLPPWP